MLVLSSRLFQVPSRQTTSRCFLCMFAGKFGVQKPTHNGNPASVRQGPMIHAGADDDPSTLGRGPNDSLKQLEAPCLSQVKSAVHVQDVAGDVARHRRAEKEGG